MREASLVVFLDPDSLFTDGQEAAVRAAGFQFELVQQTDAAIGLLNRVSAVAVVLVEGQGCSGPDLSLVREARGKGIRLFGLISPAGSGEALGRQGRRYDAWCSRDSPPEELAARLGQLLGDGAANSPIPIDSRLIGMIIHDLRNPLNTIGLTLKVIEQMPAIERASIQEDLGFIRDVAAQMEKNLAVLSDLCQLGSLPPAGPVEFDPGRFLDELLHERSHKSHEKSYPARLGIIPTGQSRVVIDPVRCRLALIASLSNASGATDRPLVVESTVDSGRWTIRIVVEKQPPSMVRSVEGRPEKFDRLIGTSSERQALDFAVAAWAAREVGGSVRLEVAKGEKSTIVLDFPERPSTSDDGAT